MSDKNSTGAPNDALIDIPILKDPHRQQKLIDEAYNDDNVVVFRGITVTKFDNPLDWNHKTIMVTILKTDPETDMWKNIGVLRRFNYTNNIHEPLFVGINEPITPGLYQLDMTSDYNMQLIDGPEISICAIL